MTVRHFMSRPWIWGLLALIVAGLVIGPQGPNKLFKQRRSYDELFAEQLTRAWQSAHCPPEAQRNIEEITLTDGTVADVEILDLPGGRIYVPRRWTGVTRHLAGPSPDGVFAATSGIGGFEPRRPLTSDYCRAIAHKSVVRQNQPDRNVDHFRIRLHFGDKSKYKPSRTMYFPTMTIAFFGQEAPKLDSLPLLRLPPKSQRKNDQDLGFGWRTHERETRHLRKRIAYDARAETEGRPVAKAPEVWEGWALVFPLEENIRAMVIVKPKSPVSEWRTYGGISEKVLNWLRMKPADRTSTLDI